MRFLARDPFRPRPVGERAEVLGTRPENQRVVRDIDEWMTDRRQLPVDDGGDARLGRVNEKIAGPIVAVNDGRGLIGRNVRRQPLDQPFHRVDAQALASVWLPAESMAAAQRSDCRGLPGTCNSLRSFSSLAPSRFK